MTSDVPLTEENARLSRLVSGLAFVLVGLSALVFLSWLVVAAGHVDDRYLVGGPWTALSQSVDHGVLYPPLYDGHAYGGTRYMPLQFLAYAAGAQITGEFFVSAKLVVYLIAAGLFGVTYVSLRRLGCGRAVAIALVAVALTTAPVLSASTSILGDSLATLAQLAALGAVSFAAGRKSSAVAGGLCAAAFLSKLTALWAPVAILVWLSATDRRRLPAFLAAFVALSAGGAIVLDVASDGRMLENITALAFSHKLGVHQLLVDAPRYFTTLMSEKAAATWLLVPFALAGTILAAARARLTVYHVSLAVALPLTILVLTDEGAYWNHLIDVVFLIVLVSGELAARLSAGAGRTEVGSVVLSTALVVGIASGYLTLVANEVRDGVRALGIGQPRRVYSNSALADAVGRDDVLLSEDASVPVSLGHRPIVLDPFMLLRLVRKHPDWGSDLVRRLDDREFDKIVLLYRLDPESQWYTKVHFGRAISTAISRNYRFARRVQTYWVYVPRVDEPPAGVQTRIPLE
jgi:hypothetical protein